jgi:predicted secreted hydrolase
LSARLVPVTAAVLMSLIGVLASSFAATDEPRYAEVLPGHALQFPKDFGSHPDYRTEWWYVTGWLETSSGEPLGFQITFFRTRPAIDESNPSAFTPRELLIAHCALSDSKRGHLWQEQSIQRAALGLAHAAVGDTDIAIDRWLLKRNADGYSATIDADDFAIHVRLTPTEAPLENGASGVSRKGAAPQAASYYYSLPHLKVDGSIERAHHMDRVGGEAWLDHEWSSEFLEAGAVGWDWTGINLADGGALMAFRIRGSSGEPRWAGATLRSADGTTRVFGPDAVSFRPLREWTSPRTGIRYPVEWRLSVGSREFEFSPLMDDQENDTRLSTGAIYWEGAVRASEAHRPAGRGYLELTGYGEALHLR